MEAWWEMILKQTTCIQSSAQKVASEENEE